MKPMRLSGSRPVGRGRPFESDAAELMLDHIGCYPFAVQIYGRAAWRASQGAEVIDLAAVQRALPDAARRLDRTVHRDHWVQASDAEGGASWR
jgi:hypothetical protein